MADTDIEADIYTENEIMSDTDDAHGLKIQGEGHWGFCQILGGRVYSGCENFLGRVHLFGVLLHFY